jgi:hypothetical protein
MGNINTVQEGTATQFRQSINDNFTELNNRVPENCTTITLINKTGSASVTGTVVSASTSTNNAFMVNPLNGDMPIGVVLDNGIADGQPCRIVVSGVAEVLVVNNTATTRGHIAYSSGTTSGRVDTSASVPASTTHFREIGHTLESKSSGSNVLVKCVLHFN